MEQRQTDELDQLGTWAMVIIGLSVGAFGVCTAIALL